MNQKLLITIRAIAFVQLYASHHKIHVRGTHYAYNRAHCRWIVWICGIRLHFIIIYVLYILLVGAAFNVR